jgi:hypothetical protein
MTTGIYANAHKRALLQPEVASCCRWHHSSVPISGGHNSYQVVLYSQQTKSECRSQHPVHYTDHMLVAQLYALPLHGSLCGAL